MHQSAGIDVVTEFTDNPIPRCCISLVAVQLMQDQEVGAIFLDYIEVIISKDIIFTRDMEDPDCLAVVTINRWIDATRGVVSPLDLLELVTEVIAGRLGCSGSLKEHQGCQ